MKAEHHFALLAPVPLEHLVSGRAVAESEGFVAFGTRKWELLAQLDTMRDGAPVPVLIYPSAEDQPAANTPAVSWFGWYVGHVPVDHGVHPAGMKHRPPTTAAYPADNVGHWAAFWHVQGLRELPKEKRLPINRIETLKGGRRKNAPPRSPELVVLPELLSYET